MMIMCVLMAYSLCQVAKGWDPVLECILPGMRGCLWLRLVKLGIKWCCFLRTQLQQLYPILKRPSSMTIGGPGFVPSWVTGRSYSRQEGGEILLVCGYHDGREVRYGSGPGLVMFRLVVYPLQPGVLGLYLIWGAWFPSRLPLEKTGTYLEFWVAHGTRVTGPQ
jgi:hypothetical protein